MKSHSEIFRAKPFDDHMAPDLGETTLLRQVSGCHDPQASNRDGHATGPPQEAYRFAYRNSEEGYNKVDGMHMNQISFAANEGCLVFWSISEDEQASGGDWIEPIRADVSSVLDVHNFLVATRAPGDTQTLAEKLQYAEPTGDDADDIGLFDHLSRQDFYVWAQGCPADDVCGAICLYAI